jgi:hypothetical protein
MHKRHLDEGVVEATLGCILKYQDDIKRFMEEIWNDPEQRINYLESPPEDE